MNIEADLIDTLTIHKDERGDLCPISFLDIPFEPKRIFYITNAPENIIRGGHGHYKNNQYCICMAGYISMTVYDGILEKTISLSKGQAILIPNMVWTSEMFRTGKDILLVICSEEYKTEDYFTDKEICTLNVFNEKFKK